MAISFSLLYYLYLAGVVVFFVFVFFNVYHLLRFVPLDFLSSIIIIIFLLGSAAILIVSWQFTNQIDWHQELQLIPSFD